MGYLRVIPLGMFRRPVQNGGLLILVFCNTDHATTTGPQAGALIIAATSSATTARPIRRGILRLGPVSGARHNANMTYQQSKGNNAYSFDRNPSAPALRASWRIAISITSARPMP